MTSARIVNALIEIYCLLNDVDIRIFNKASKTLCACVCVSNNHSQQYFNSSVVNIFKFVFTLSKSFNNLQLLTVA